jgi:hypothetical protein
VHKLYAFVPMTEELLEDAPMIERYLNDKSAAKMDYAITNAIINGSGNGQPLGILKAGCLVSVAKESTQAAATIVGANILKAYARQMNPGRSVWLCNTVVVTEACATLGTVGDVIFADLAGGYFAPYKAGGVQAAVSMHLYFDQGLNAFRWSFRVGGQPWLSAAVTPASGSANTKSSMVALATR